MSDLKAKIQQNRFWLQLRPRPCWDLTVLPRSSIVGFKGPISKGRGRKGRGGNEKRGGDARGEKGPSLRW